eukprot:Amastigsp_a677247_8.p5 type:complete len:122 gc:universal Amastigsp_a677247_8:852-487(-)
MEENRNVRGLQVLESRWRRVPVKLLNYEPPRHCALRRHERVREDRVAAAEINNGERFALVKVGKVIVADRVLDGSSNESGRHKLVGPVEALFNVRSVERAMSVFRLKRARVGLLVEHSEPF